MFDPYNHNVDNPYNNGNPNPDHNNPYAQGGPYPPYKKPGGDALATAAMTLGILSVATGVMLQFYLAMIFGSIGIVLALLSKGAAPKLTSRAKTGIISASAGLFFSAFLCISTLAALYTNPELMDQVNDIFTQQYGVSYEEMMDTIINGGELP